MSTCCARPEEERLGAAPTVRVQTRRCVRNLFVNCFTSFDHYDRVLYNGSPHNLKSGFEPVSEMAVPNDELDFSKAPIMTFKHKVQAALQVALQYGARRAAKFTLRMMSGPFLQATQGEGSKEIEQLVKRLSSQRSSKREEAACILAVYTDLEPTYRRRVLDEGALEKILPLLKSRSMGSRCAAADVLGQLARDPVVRTEILESDPVPRLTKLLRRRYNVSVRTSCAKALSSLAVGNDHIEMMLAAAPLIFTVIHVLMKVAEEISPVPGRCVRERRKSALLAALLELVARLAQHDSVREEIVQNDELFNLLCTKIYFMEASVVTSAMELTLQLIKVDALRVKFLERGMLSHLSQIWQESSGKCQVQALRVLAELATSPKTHESIHNSISRKRSYLSKVKVQALFGSFESDEDSIGVFNLASCLPINHGTAAYLYKSGVGRMVLSYLDLGSPKLTAPVCRLTGSLTSGEAIRQELEDGGAISYLIDYMFWDDLEVVESAVTALAKFAESGSSILECNSPRILGRLLELQDMEDQDMIYTSLELLRHLAKFDTVKRTLRSLDLRIR